MSNNELNMVHEPRQKWGGDWTKRKLDAFAKYENI